MTDIISFKNAKALNLKRYFTGKPCKRGHIDERHVSDSSCVTCNREYGKRWSEKNPERTRERGKRWREKNLELARERGKRWYVENRERSKESGKRWREKNRESEQEKARQWYIENREFARERGKRWREKNPELERERGKRWYAKNIHKIRSYEAKYRAMKLKATPLWLLPIQEKQIVALYLKAQILTKKTGVQYHVDHRFPLIAKRRGSSKQIASGLHVPWNLQVIPAVRNMSKNCYIDDLPMHELVGCADSLSADQARTAQVHSNPNPSRSNFDLVSGRL